MKRRDSALAKTLQGAIDYGPLEERGLADDLLCWSEGQILGDRSAARSV
jgi:hypothetical protein